jgi:hypothetical protein
VRVTVDASTQPDSKCPAVPSVGAVRDAISHATEPAGAAETEIVRAHAGMSKLALALKESRTMRVQTVDLVIPARELAAGARVGPVS